MRQRMRPLAFVSLGSILVVAIALAAVAALPWPSGPRPVANRSVTLEPGQTWTQRLEPAHAGLGRIDLALERDGPRTGSMRLVLSADPDGRQPLARADTPVEAVDDVSRSIRRPDPFVPFRLIALREIGVGPIWLRLESRADRPVRVRYWEREDGAKTTSLRLYYRQTPADRLVAFAARVTRSRPGVMQGVGLYLVVLALYGGLTGATLARLSGRFC